MSSPAVLLAPDSFKGSLDALQVCHALEEGIRRVVPTCRIVRCPIADGGEGTVAVLAAAIDAILQHADVHDPLGRPIRAEFARSRDGGTSIVEAAAAAGLNLLRPAERDPLQASSRGLGELIGQALRPPCRTLIVGIGGTATVDGGAGMLQALGFRLTDRRGQDLRGGGAALAGLAAIAAPVGSPPWHATVIRVMCDVDHPLVGPRGAAAVFGPQKGATPEGVRQLDDNLRHFAAIVERDLGVAIADRPGCGAAGGVGAALLAATGARLERGIDVVLQLVDFSAKVRGCSLVITGEGCLDAQSAGGKAPQGVALAAHQAGVPVVAVAGQVREPLPPELRKLFAGVFPLCDGTVAPAEAMAGAGRLLVERGAAIARRFLT